MENKDSKPSPPQAYWRALAGLEAVMPGLFAQLRRLKLEESLPLPREEMLARGWKGSPRTLSACSSLRLDEAQETLDAEESLGLCFIAFGDACYPAALASSMHALPGLWCRGAKPVPGALYPLAMVGTRTPGPWAFSYVRLLGETLRETPVCIVSGLAQGIDSLCHGMALDEGYPTLAVLAQGLEQRLAGSRQLLARRILEAGGALLSPFPPGTLPHPGRFIERNRTIAGLSQSTLLVESREDGGAMHTVHYALQDQRPVLAVPGDTWRDTAQGANSLLRAGLARALWKPLDLPGLLGFSSPRPLHAKEKLPPEWRPYSGSRHSLDQLCTRSGKPIGELLAILTLLELQGLCQVQGGQWVLFY